MTTIKYCKKEKKILNTLNTTPCTMFKSPTNYMLHTAKFTIRSRNERLTIEDFKKNNDFVYQDVFAIFKNDALLFAFIQRVSTSIVIYIKRKNWQQ